jgi:hypothetical protein
MPDTLDAVELAALRADKHWYDAFSEECFCSFWKPRWRRQRAIVPFIIPCSRLLEMHSLGFSYLLETKASAAHQGPLDLPASRLHSRPPDPEPADTGFCWPPIPSGKIEIVNRRETIATRARVAGMLFFFAPAILGGQEWRWWIPVISVPLAAVLWFERPRPNASFLAPHSLHIGWSRELARACAGKAGG